MQLPAGGEGMVGWGVGGGWGGVVESSLLYGLLDAG